MEAGTDLNQQNFIRGDAELAALGFPDRPRMFRASAVGGNTRRQQPEPFGGGVVNLLKVA